MFAEIITIGDEILIGQIVDTNSTFIATELNKIGVSVYQITSVQDDRDHILNALSEAQERAELVIITGGLGPTKDDITKHTLCEFTDDNLIENTEVLGHIEELFRSYISTPISNVNRQQAFVPSKAKVLHNAYGTAPGMWITMEKTTIVSLPGVPFEMKSLLTNEVIPKVMATFDRPYIYHKTIMTYGMGESSIANIIEDWEDNLPSFIKLAYLPNLGKVRLRLTAKGSDRSLIEERVRMESKKLYSLIGDIITGEEESGTIEAVVAKLLTDKHLKLATAESFTGGKIAEQFTAIPGASAFFLGSIVSYATEMKVNLLNIPNELIQEHSVVSAEVAEAMALNVKTIMKSDFAIATTGNAGPTKGDSDAPIGTVYIAIATPNSVFSVKSLLGNHRTRIVQKAVHMAIQMLQKEILKF
ncbi:competence/damage-inducible protein A [Eudoraea chungangensis]|uniref:competence/damage-inducible protein A n=1 Tax=Eudoraea chungangensis TaxID=1481905 RepID=UPI0023EB95B7|nr:competence/damage-inducible protein A [Eudoraea chungangensis]